MPPTLTKQEADYHIARSTYDRNRYCKDCSMFRHGAACSLVKGSIDPGGTCQHYDPKE